MSFLINIDKYVELLKIAAFAFVTAFAGSYFFGWDTQFGVLIGLLLGIWESIFELIYSHYLIPRDSVAKEE